MSSVILLRVTLGYDLDPGAIPDVTASPGDSVLYSVDPPIAVDYIEETKPFKINDYNVLGIHLTPQSDLNLVRQIQPDLKAYVKMQREYPGRIITSLCFQDTSWKSIIQATSMILSSVLNAMRCMFIKTRLFAWNL